MCEKMYHPMSESRYISDPSPSKSKLICLWFDMRTASEKMYHLCLVISAFDSIQLWLYGAGGSMTYPLLFIGWYIISHIPESDSWLFCNYMFHLFQSCTLAYHTVLKHVVVLSHWRRRQHYRLAENVRALSDPFATALSKDTPCDGPTGMERGSHTVQTVLAI